MGPQDQAQREDCPGSVRGGGQARGSPGRARDPQCWQGHRARRHRGAKDPDGPGCGPERPEGQLRDGSPAGSGLCNPEGVTLATHTAHTPALTRTSCPHICSGPGRGWAADHTDRLAGGDRAREARRPNPRARSALPTGAGRRGTLQTGEERHFPTRGILGEATCEPWMGSSRAHAHREPLASHPGPRRRQGLHPYSQCPSSGVPPSPLQLLARCHPTLQLKGRTPWGGEKGGGPEPHRAVLGALGSSCLQPQDTCPGLLSL